MAINLRIMEKKMKKSSWKKLKIELSDDSLGDTPVPMPNTEVKTWNAGSSWGLPPVRYGSRLAFLYPP